MKTILAAALTVLSLGTAQAVEYVGLTKSSPLKAVASTDLVEVVGYFPINRRGEIQLELIYRDGTTSGSFEIGSGYGVGGAALKNKAIVGQKFTRLQSIILHSNEAINPTITLKITSASEINAVTPSAVLVLPENSTGNFDVVIEASDDLVNWLPFFSQTVNSQTANKFFRARVVRSEAPVQKP
jgi:hypothetical protein